MRDLANPRIMPAGEVLYGRNTPQVSTQFFSHQTWLRMPVSRQSFASTARWNEEYDGRKGT
jgi:hypothetical protein